MKSSANFKVTDQLPSHSRLSAKLRVKREKRQGDRGERGNPRWKSQSFLYPNTESNNL